jgi:hypothetical protein
MRLLAPAAVMVLVPLLVNAGLFARNEALFHNPLAPGDETSSAVNATHTPAALISNLLRDSVLQLGTPIPEVNQRLEWAIDRIHTRILHIDPSDPRTSWGGATFMVNTLTFDEDYAGDPLQALAAIAVVVTALATWRRSRMLAWYAGSLIVAFVLFAGYLKWQPWHARLELPLLVASGPLIGTVLARRFGGAASTVIACLLFAGAVPYVIDNQTRPLVGFGLLPNSRELPEGATIFNTPRMDLYYAKYSTLEVPYRRVADDAKVADCRDIGLVAGGNDWEYPLWAQAQALDSGARFDHVLVKNASANATQFGSTPCLLVVTETGHGATLQVDGQTFAEVWNENGVALYRRAP